MNIFSKQRRSLAWILLAAATGGLGVYLNLTGAHLGPVPAVLICGSSIVGAAFLLSWGAEAAQVDVSASLAIAVLAILTVLPEYSVEFVLARSAGHAFAVNPTAPEVSYVSANVTGANRLLIGLGWSMVVLVYWLKRKQPLEINQSLNLEISILLVAALLGFVIVATGSVPIWLSLILGGLYVWYMWMTSRQAVGEPDLEGPAAFIGSMTKAKRRAVVLLLLIYAATVILTMAEPFVEGVINAGEVLGIDKFLMVQWVAPLASESPEIVVAAIFALRGLPLASMTTLISAEVSQMTALIATMPLVFSTALGHAHSLPVDSRQSTEFLLTIALAIFAIVLIARMRIGPWHAMLLLGIFVGHLLFPNEEARLIAAWLVFGLTGLLLATDPGRIKAILLMFRSLAPRRTNK